ncbi:MAG: DsbA family protein [Candidatus Woesearchaeota archaeon]
MAEEERNNDGDEPLKGPRITHIQRESSPKSEPDNFWKIAAFGFLILLIVSIGTRGFTSFDLFAGTDPTGRAILPGDDVQVDGFYFLGDENAPVTIIEYSDYMCPFCQRHHVQTLPRIMENYIETGKVRYAFVDYPAIRHPVTEPAANAAWCAGDQGRYYEYNDIIFSNFDSLRTVTGNPNAQLLGFGEQLGLDMDAFTECVEAGRHLDGIMQRAQEASQRGVQATPTFFINDVMVRGAQDYRVFEEYIEQALAGDLEAPPPQVEEIVEQLPSSPEIITFSVQGPMLGDSEAPISISDFSSYQCPFCARFHLQTLPHIRSEYIEEGIVRMYARDFPLAMQVNSAPAANAAHCAGDQDSYFEYQSILYNRQSTWASLPNPTDAFVSYAVELNLDEDIFRSCVEDSVHAQRVQSDFGVGQSVGVSGTPSFIVLTSKENVDVDALVELQMPDGRGGFFIRYIETEEGLAGARVVGAQPAEVFDAVISALR